MRQFPPNVSDHLSRVYRYLLYFTVLFSGANWLGMKSGISEWILVFGSLLVTIVLLMLMVIPIVNKIVCASGIAF